MSNTLYYEDIFSNFYTLCEWDIESQDVSPCQSFYQRITSSLPLTKKQAYLAVKILQKYKILSTSKGYDYASQLPQATWKLPFREIDQTRNIRVEANDQGSIKLLVKFPYVLKKEFDSLFSNINHPWDPEKQCRVVDFYQIDLIKLSEFLLKHNFTIDQSFSEALESVENIFEKKFDIIPYSRVRNDQIVLVNASEDATNYFNSHRKNDIFQDSFLAKIMGYPVAPEISEGSFQKLVSSKNSTFHIENFDKFFNLYKKISGKIALIFDRTSNIKTMIQEFVNAADAAGIDRKKIKVCFRESGDFKTDFNDWVRDNSLGGKIEEGEIYIFRHTPPKWLFEKDIFVNIVITNNLTPSTSTKTQAWLNSHHCVMYLGDIKPTMIKGQKIVKL